ncbi:MAG: hypothetical protein ACPL7B_08465 [Candidatus Poribacteria bacterium]
MPDIRYSIRVVDRNGKGISNEKVSVHYELTFDSNWTDSDGWVTFEKSNLIYNGIKVDVYFRGKLLGKISWAENGDTFSFTYNY